MGVRTTPVGCPRCGVSNDPLAKFCSSCGQDLTPAAVTQWQQAKPKGNPSLRTFFVILAVLLVGGGIYSLWKGTPSSGSSGTRSTAPVERTLESQMYVLVKSCSQDQATGTVRNDSTSRVNVYVQVDFLDAKGVVLHDGLDSVSSLRVGETANWDTPFLGRGAVERCRAAASSAFEQD